MTTVTADFFVPAEVLAAVASDVDSCFPIELLSGHSGGGTAASDGWAPIEALGTFRTDADYRAESGIGLLSGDSWLPIEIQAFAQSPPVAIEILAMARGEPGPPMESVARFSLDTWPPIESLTSHSVTTDRSVPAEVFAAQAADSELRVEIGESVAAAAMLPAESGETVAADPLPPAEALGTQRADRGPLAEIAALFGWDRPQPVELSGSPLLGAISQAPIEAPSTARADSHPVEWGALLRRDLSTQAESATMQLGARSGLAESATAYRLDLSAPGESGATARADAWTPIEALQTAVRDGATVEILGMIRADPNSGAEFDGAILRIFDPAFPVEARSSLVSDRPVPAGVLMSLQRDGAPIEWLAVIASAAVAANGLGPIEATGIFQADKLGTVEWAALAESDRQAALEWFRTLFAAPVSNTYLQIEASMTLPPPLVYVSQGRLRKPSPSLAQPRPFRPMAPGESDNFAFDFTTEIGAASIVSTSWACALRPFQTVIDAAAQSHIIGAPSGETRLGVYAPQDSPECPTASPFGWVVEAGAFSAALVGGFTPADAGAIYTLSATIMTSDGRTLSLSADLPVASRD